MPDQLLGVCVVYVLGLAYLLPSLIAARRRHPQLASIVLRNAAVGWTAVVWAACLVAAIRSSGPSAARSVASREDRAWAAVPAPAASLQLLSRAGLS